MDQEATTTDNLANPSLTCFYNCCIDTFSSSCITSPLQAWGGDCCLLPSIIIWGIAKGFTFLSGISLLHQCLDQLDTAQIWFFSMSKLQRIPKKQSLLSSFLVHFHWCFKKFKKLASFTPLQSSLHIIVPHYECITLNIVKLQTSGESWRPFKVTCSLPLLNVCLIKICILVSWWDRTSTRRSLKIQNNAAI